MRYPLASATKPTKRWRLAAALAATVAVVAGCGGGASDVVGDEGGTEADVTLTVVAYAVPEPGWRKIISAFAETESGKGIAVVNSQG